jgi:hypothetical protein
VPFVLLTFKDIFRKHWYIVDADPQLKPIFNHPPLMVFKRSTNVRDIVVKSDYPPEKREILLDKVPEGKYKSGQCAQCSFTYKCNSFTQTLQRTKIYDQRPDYLHVHQCCLHVEITLWLVLHMEHFHSLKTRISELRKNTQTGETKNPVADHFAHAGLPISSMRYIGLEMVKMLCRGGDIERELT